MYMHDHLLVIHVTCCPLVPCTGIQRPAMAGIGNATAFRLLVSPPQCY